MRSHSDIEEYLDINTQMAMDDFQSEISTHENKDYRRGFRAGVLFAYLHARANIGNLDDATTEQPTD